MKKIIILLLSLLSLNLFAGIDPKVAYGQVKNGDAVLIDVREADEIKAGMIKDAIWFPMSKITTGSDWKKDFQEMTKGKKIYLHCRSGARSEKVMNILKQNGIESENLGGYITLKNILPIGEPGHR